MDAQTKTPPRGSISGNLTNADLSDRTNPDRYTQAGVEQRQRASRERMIRPLAERSVEVALPVVTDWDAYWSGYECDEAAARQDAEWQQHLAEMDERRERVHAVMLEQWRSASWDPTASHIRTAINQRHGQHTAPRQVRATRVARTTTARRTAAMDGSASSGDDGGGELPSDPAPLGAEGRVAGSLWNPEPTVDEIHRDEHDRIRRRTRLLTTLGRLPLMDERWSS